jgi:hypothetical protein
MEQSEFSPELLKSDSGMFYMEISDKVKDAYELIEASTVTDEKKDKCREILETLLKEAKIASERDWGGVYDTARSAVERLINILSNSDVEENTLFESLRGVILKSRDSVLSWGEFKPKQ